MSDDDNSYNDDAYDDGYDNGTNDGYANGETDGYNEALDDVITEIFKLRKEQSNHINFVIIEELVENLRK